MARGEADMNWTSLGAAGWQEAPRLQEATSACLGQKNPVRAALSSPRGFPCSGRCRIPVPALGWGKRWTKSSSWGVGVGDRDGELRLLVSGPAAK